MPILVVVIPRAVGYIQDCFGKAQWPTEHPIYHGEHLKRRGRLKPDWNRAFFHQEWGEEPSIGFKSTVYCATPYR